VSRRIEIELTSARPDGTWTWRAAGAREPKGVLDGGLLTAEAKPGDVLRAEADFELEGIVITSVLTPKTETRPEPERIEIVGPGRPELPGVTTQLVSRSDRRPGERRRERDDSGRRRERAPGRPQTGRPQREDGDRPDRGGAGTGRPGAPARTDAARTGTSEGGARPERRARSDRSRLDAGKAGDHRGQGDREGDQSRPGRARRGAGDAIRSTSQAERTKAPRLSPGNAHRKAVMESLPPEQQPIAEQVLRGGIPAVRTALHLEREKAQAEGRPAPNAEELIAMAESLLPRLRAAEWRDRAEAAAASLDHITMRDLRSVVAGADVARDEETRSLAVTLREALERRIAKLHEDWCQEITAQIDANKIVRALRLSARPPEPSARLEAETAQRLASAAGAAMAPDAAPDLWAALLEAAAESPVRRSVVPTGLPDNAPPDLKRAAHQMSGTIPALAKLLGVTIPPPPAPVAARRRPDSPTGGGGRKKGGGNRPSKGSAGRPPAERASDVQGDHPATGGHTAASADRPASEADDVEAQARSETSGVPETQPEPTPDPATNGDDSSS
jgi:hypothetical protein